MPNYMIENITIEYYICLAYENHDPSIDVIEKKSFQYKCNLVVMMPLT